LLAYRLLRDINAEGLVFSAREQTCFLETIRAIQAIKLSGRETDRRNRWINLKVDSINRGLDKQKIELLFENLNMAISGIVGVATFRIGATSVIDGGFTIGMLVAFGSFAMQFNARMSALIDSLIGFRMLSVHMDRLSDIVLESPEFDGHVNIPKDQPQCNIELINVAFRYSQTDPWILKDFNLTIGPGESIAFAGPSGCGKTTLIKLIIGILQPSEGEIRYGGVPIQTLGTKQYRKILAAVMQDDQLLSGSVRENICFYDQKPDQNHIIRCAKLAAIHDELCNMPMGYETVVGEMGATLSGGQRQRVLLARALYKNPMVLILDEATSHLDNSLEQTINSAVARLNITRIIVAHRRETIESAQRIVYLHNGRIESDRKNRAQVEHKLP
jgi:ATP-binding cassette subfamily B protein RaxB